MARCGIVSVTESSDGVPIHNSRTIRVSSTRRGQFQFQMTIGPKVVFCAESLVDALINAQSDHHVRLKAVEASFHLELVTEHMESEDGTTIGELTAGDLNRPFVELLREKELHVSNFEIILYAIALVDNDQEQMSDAASLISTKDGLQTLARYLASASKFPDAPGAFLYPMYGHGDEPQAFCRCAAVRGALYVLRMPVVNLLLDKAISENLTEVARCLCITDQSLQPGLSTILVIFPPNCLNGRKSKVVRVLQLGVASDVCPDGKYIVQLAVKCSDATEAKETLQAAKDALFCGVDTELDKPKLLWSILFIQKIPNSSQAIRGLKMCVMPDSTIDYRSMMNTLRRSFINCFQRMSFFDKLPSTYTSDQGDGDADADADGIDAL